MANQQFSQYLSHLRPNEIQELIEFYYSSEFSVAELLEMFQLKVASSYLVSCFPPFEDLNTICPYCNIPMLRNWNSRAYPGKGRLSSDAYCSSCGHKAFRENSWKNCDCENCIKVEQLKEEQRDSLEWEAIYKVYGRDKTFRFKNDISQIDLKSAVYLLAMERQSVSGEIGIFSPLIDSEIPCTHNSEFTLEIVNYLTNYGYMHVDPSSNKNAFDYKSENIPYYVYRVQYYADLGLSLQESKKSIRYLEHCFLNKQWPKVWRADPLDIVFELWQKISMYECLDYLNRLGVERGFSMPHGDKTKAVLVDALGDQPTAAVYSFIWSSVVKASDYYQSKDISLQQAANSVVGNIQSSADKVRLGEWQPRMYGRQKGFRNSALYEVLFNLVLQIGEAGFNSTFIDCLPSCDWIFALPDDEA